MYNPLHKEGAATVPRGMCSASGKPRFSPVQGFTLVETVVTVALTAIVGIALLSMISYFYRSNAHLLEATSAVESGNRGLRETLNALREASYAEDGAYPVLSAATSSITFYGSLDEDVAAERIRLYLSDSTLYRGVTNPSGSPLSYEGQPEAIDIIATHIRNDVSVPLFRYYDETGIELLDTIDIARIRSVQVRLEVDINPNRAPNIFILEGSATLRNLRTN